MKVFSKDKMLDRLGREGRLHMVDDDSIKIMETLDGQEAHKNDFKALVYDELEYFVRVGDKSYPVNPNDCIDK